MLFWHCGTGHFSARFSGNLFRTAGSLSLCLIHTHTYTYTCTHTRTHTHTHTRTHTHARARAHAHTDIQGYTHTDTQTDRHTLAGVRLDEFPPGEVVCVCEHVCVCVLYMRLVLIYSRQGGECDPEHQLWRSPM